MNTNTQHQGHFCFLSDRIEMVLAHILPQESSSPTRLHQAMHYSVLNGGKRIRPLMVYGVAGLFQDLTNANDITLTDRAAAAVELIHAYSLIHDDLPAMDNDDLRRGKPTCHRAFDEATAILAGDALQALAFHLLTVRDSQVTAEIQLQMMDVLARLIGSLGMAGGQALDLETEKTPTSSTDLEKIYALKTGALLEASVILGALSVGCYDPSTFQKLKQFAHAIGIAFQIRDDILDLESSTEVLGKRQGADLARNKTTYPIVLGLSAAKKRVEALYQEASQILEIWGEKSSFLCSLTEVIVRRQY